MNVRGGSITGGAQGAAIASGAAFKAAFLTVTKVWFQRIRTATLSLLGPQGRVAA